MIMKLLTKDEYNLCFEPPMVNVSDTAEELVDLWGYADQVIESDYHSCTAWDWRIDHIYETSKGTYQHIGIPVPKDNTYLLVIVDKLKKCIIGHYILELGN